MLQELTANLSMQVRQGVLAVTAYNYDHVQPQGKPLTHGVAIDNSKIIMGCFAWTK